MEQNRANSSQPQWYVLRDMRRANARQTAYEQLLEAGYEVFTPMRWEVVHHHGGTHTRRRIPILPDLLFINTTREIFDPHLSRIPSLQYRYVRGSQATPMVVREADMRLFISAVSSSADPRYYMPEEVSADMCGRRIRIVGGPLDGYEGNLLKVRGAKTKRLLVNLAGLITAAVEVEPEYIQLV